MLFFSFSCVLCTYVCIHSLKSRDQKAHSTARVRHEPLLSREWLSLPGYCTVIMGIRLVKERRQTRGSLSGSGGWWLVAGGGCFDGVCLDFRWSKRFCTENWRWKKKRRERDRRHDDVVCSCFSIHLSISNQSIHQKKAFYTVGSWISCQSVWSPRVNTLPRFVTNHHYPRCTLNFLF